MPIVGYACPTTARKAGEWHTPEYCITKCDEKCLSPFVIAWITYNQQVNHHVGRYVSATSLAGCSRRLLLERTVEYVEGFDDVWASSRGTLIHGMVEAAAEAKLFRDKTLLDLGFLSEWRMLMGWCLDCARPFQLAPEVTSETFDEKCPRCGGMETFGLGGTLDGLGPAMYYGLGEFDQETGVMEMVLEDAKTMKDGYAVNLFVRGDRSKNPLHGHIKDDHVMQANLYRVLGEQSQPPPQLRERGVKRIKMVQSRIQAISMGRGVYTGGQPFMHQEESRSPNKECRVPPIEFLPEQDVYDYIQERAPAIYHSLILRQTRGTLPRPEGNKQGLLSWQCMFCAFSHGEHCPNAKVEHQALQEGAAPEEAFEKAMRVYTGEEEAPPPPPPPPKTRKFPEIVGQREGKLTKPQQVLVDALREGASIHEQLEPTYMACLMGGKVKGTPEVKKAQIDGLYKQGWLGYVAAEGAEGAMYYRYDLHSQSETPTGGTER